MKNYEFFLCSVQFHPEHCAGPQDLEDLFDVFLQLALQSKNDPPKSWNLPEKINDFLTFKLVFQ